MPRKKDENQAAFSSLQELLRRDAERDGKRVPPIPEEEKDKKAAISGRIGGLKGGKARAEKLSKRKRVKIAKIAAAARWSRKEV